MTADNITACVLDTGEMITMVLRRTGGLLVLELDVCKQRLGTLGFCTFPDVAPYQQR